MVRMMRKNKDGYKIKGKKESIDRQYKKKKECKIIKIIVRIFKIKI